MRERSTSWKYLIQDYLPKLKNSIFVYLLSLSSRMCSNTWLNILQSQRDKTDLVAWENCLLLVSWIDMFHMGARWHCEIQESFIDHMNRMENGMKLFLRWGSDCFSGCLLPSTSNQDGMNAKLLGSLLL